MNICHRLVSFRFALLLLTLLLPTALGQVRVDGPELPDSIAATDDTTGVRALTAWAEQHRDTQPEQAKQAAQRALALARELKDQQGIGNNLLLLGDLSSDELSRARYYTEAQEAFEKIEDERALAHSWISMGNVHANREKPEDALAFYLDALRRLERLGDTVGQAKALNNIGLLHKNQNNLEEALAHYEQAVNLLEPSDKPTLLARVLTNLAVALGEQGLYEDAETQFRRALALSEEQEASLFTAANANNFGSLLNKQGRHEQALPFLVTAERLASELDEDGLLFAVRDELGKAYLGLGQYNRALQYADAALALAREREAIGEQMDVHRTLSRIYEAVGDDGNAFAHYRQYAAARDSIFTTEKAEILAEMQTRYETEQKQRAIESLQQERRVQALQARQQRILRNVLLGAVAVSLLIAGLFYNRYRLNRRANHLLEELDAAKSHFFANISHEFRTPLTVMLGGAQDILGGRFGTVSDRVAEELQAMLRNARRLQHLIDEVLDLNRLEAGKLELQPTPGDLIPPLQRLIEANAPLAERNDIDLTFDPNVEHCPRLYDTGKLEKIVSNLLSNALKFTPKGGAVQVTLRCGTETEISVSDSGPGIPAEKQETVFDRFAQVEEGSQHGGLSAVPGTAQAGTGIGLALAKELAELHGGTIALESEPGKGSTFTVRLPLETVPLDDVASTGLPRRHSTEPGRPTLQEGNSLPEEEFDIGGNGAAPSEQRDAAEADDGGSETTEDRTTILVIEDNDDVRAYVRRSLGETYRVLEAADGETGLQQARSELPDLIVSDVMLPGIDGYEVARQLKAEANTECIPVVMLTARATEEDQAEGYGSGAEVYITKPFAPETLRAACARLLEERKRLRRRLQEDAKQNGVDTSQNSLPSLTNRARTVALKNLHDEDFGVEELASALNMTRHTLYNRFMSEVGASPRDFVRTLRLERAHELLGNGAGSVSEVAYAVGFKSLSAFSHTYRSHYGTPPSSHLVRADDPSE